MEKIRISVIFGGRSGEHEVSLVSATSVIKALDKEKYEIIETGITVDGTWYVGDNCLEKFKKQDYEGLEILSFEMDAKAENRPDICFPVLHGPFGEDGTIQGLMEMLQMPYVGCDVMGSAVAMDKLQCKRVWQAAGLPVVDWVDFTRREWQENAGLIYDKIIEDIGIPCFVKPVNMGSSVGITKVKDKSQLKTAIDLAAAFDRKIMVEKAINVREIECAILGNEDLEVAPLGEVLVGGEFYDFNDKYIDGVSTTDVPAKLDDKMMVEVRKNAELAYRTVGCCGLARVDTFIDQDNGDIYLNEINTMPGFTSISMYPKMMAAHGIPYPELVDRLITLGFERFEERQKNKIVFSSDSDWFKG